MAARRFVLLVLAGVFASPSFLWAATYRTTNFVVEAPNGQIAEQAGKYAEFYRKEKALQWLGQEMQTWPQPCPLRITVTMDGAGGATEFRFENGQVVSQNMHVEGTLERILNSVLPHEITHTVFAYYFRCPVPRWADEGGAVLSEDEVERHRHDSLARQVLTAGRAFPLRTLFSLRDYPRTSNDVMALYAEGYSVVDFLVSNSNRPAFLAFVAQGMREGWDRAVQVHYRYSNVNELEQAWLNHLKNTRGQPAQLARNTVDADPARRVVVRQTAPPALPVVLEAPKPIYRGQAPTEDDQEGAATGGWNTPGSLSRERGPVRSEQPVRGGNAIRLGTPEYLSGQGSPLGRPIPAAVSPVGYPH